jgi:hemolysin III
MGNQHKQPLVFSWDYDSSEIVADGIVHAVGICFGLIGGALLVILSAGHSPTIVAALSVYAASLAVMLGISGAYNMWPVSNTKWLLRRFDHSAIYLLIAGTYTPLIAQSKITLSSSVLLIVLWMTAAVGIILKLVAPGRFDGVAIVFYLILGWCGVFAYDSVFAILPSLIFWLLAAGGLLYSAGVSFHLLSSLRFQNAIWHVFVLLGAACHYAAVLKYVALA